MTVDDETLARIRSALRDAERVDAGRVEVTRDGGDVVLRGAVATPEEATVAALIAEQDVESVRNDLRVDPGLREATSQGAPPPPGQPAPAPQRSPEDPSQPADDLTTDVSEALGESLAWDPPDAPATAPTASEQRGRVPRDVTAQPAAPEGTVDDADEVEPSAGDLSAAELERSARGDEEES